MLTLIVADNGVGLREGMESPSTSSLGMRLLETLANQLDGEAEMNGSDGTEYKITFPIA
jgi:two-component sensor histidine kinase